MRSCKPPDVGANCRRIDQFRPAALGLLLFLLPGVTFYLWFCLERNGGLLVLPTASMLESIPRPTWAAAAISVGWIAVQAMLQLCAPGRWVEGAPLADGTRLSYRMNGWFAWWFTLAMAGAGCALG